MLCYSNVRLTPVSRGRVSLLGLVALAICLIGASSAVHCGLLGAHGSKELGLVMHMLHKGPYGSSTFSVLNDYLCIHIKDDHIMANLNALAKIGKQLDKTDATKSRTLSKFLQEFNLLVELIVRAKTPDSFCTQGGQNALQAANVEMIYHGNLMRHLREKYGKSMEKQQRKCNRIGAILEHFENMRQSSCESKGGYFVNQVDLAYDSLEMTTRRKLVGSLGPFMDWLMADQLGGYSTENCKLKLSYLVDGMENFDTQAGALLWEGMNMLEPGPVPSEADPSSSAEEKKFLASFASWRNKFLLESCKTYVDKMREPIKQIRLYASMYGKPSGGPKFALNSVEDKRLHRSWAMFNTCQLIEDKLPRVSVALLRQSGYDTTKALLPKDQIVSILKST